MIWGLVDLSKVSYGVRFFGDMVLGVGVRFIGVQFYYMVITAENIAGCYTPHIGDLQACLFCLKSMGVQYTLLCVWGGVLL